MLGLFDCLCFTGHLETPSPLLSLAKDMKLGKYTVPTGNRTPGHRVAVHYATAAPCKLHIMLGGPCESIMQWGRTSYVPIAALKSGHWDNYYRGIAAISSQYVEVDVNKHH